MNSMVKKGASFFGETIREFLEDDCPMMAAAIAYYAMFSLPPLILIVITVTGFVLGDVGGGEEAARSHLRNELGRILGDAARDQIFEMVRSVRERGHGWLATLTTTGLLLLGSTGVMMQLQLALNRVWEIEPSKEGSAIKSLVLKRLLSFGMVMAVAFLLLVSLILSTVLASMVSYVSDSLPGDRSGLLMYVTQSFVTLLVITLLLAMLFRWLPDATIRWSDVWVGALVTAVLFMIGKELLGWYLGSKDPSSFGTAGTLVLLLMWVYYTSMIVMYGAEFTQVWAKSRGWAIVPEHGAVRVVREKHIRAAGPPGAPQQGDGSLPASG